MLQNKDTEPLKPNAASFILHQSNTYLSPLLKSLDRKIDKRLADTFYNLFVAILAFRNSSMGLLLSELGGYICGFDHAPAGTKRISNLLRSTKWDAALVDDFLLSRALDRIRSLREKGKRRCCCGTTAWWKSRRAGCCRACAACRAARAGG